jgi:hypothetical protein
MCSLFDSCAGADITTAGIATGPQWRIKIGRWKALDDYN